MARQRERGVEDAGNLSTSDVKRLIDSWIFNERDRAILKRRLIDGITFEKLAEEFELSVVQVKRIVKKRQIELFKHF